MLCGSGASHFAFTVEAVPLQELHGQGEVHTWVRVDRGHHRDVLPKELGEVDLVDLRATRALKAVALRVPT